MDSNYTIFVVDDDRTSRLLLQSILSDRYNVELFESGESCLEELSHRLPDLFLLDIGLPGIGGYDLCRKIKGRSESRGIPVVFISAHGALDDILAGYDAGGEDYLVKPFDVVGFYYKIENLRRIEQEKKAIMVQAQASDELATVVLASLDEYALLIKFLRRLNECADLQDVADALLQTLGTFHLDAAVQIRMRSVERTFSKTGENWPLEIAVINHVRSLERVFEFKSRAAFNFDRVTVLVSNMPVGDAELCGRIRDNVAIAAESADAKLAALQSLEDMTRVRCEMHDLVQAVEQEVQSYSRRYDEARYRGAVFTTRFLDDLLAAFAHLGMTGQQEEAILEMVRDSSQKLVELYDVTGATRSALAGLNKRLEDILSMTGGPERRD